MVVNFEEADMEDDAEDTEVVLGEDGALIEGDPFNPGGWSDQAFKERFEGSGQNRKSMGKAMPGGVKAVPVSPVSGKRTRCGWEFHYSGWEGTEGRDGASDTDPNHVLPKSRTGHVKPAFYTENSLTDASAKLHDPLFWLFSVLPLATCWQGKGGKGKGGKGKGADRAPGNRGRGSGKEPRTAPGRGSGMGASHSRTFPVKLTSKQFREKCSKAMLAFQLHGAGGSGRKYKYPGEESLNRKEASQALKRKVMISMSEVVASGVRYRDVIAHMCKMEKIKTTSKPNGGSQRNCSWCGELCSSMCGECQVPLGLQWKEGRHEKCWAFWHCPLVGGSAFASTKKKPDDNAIAAERAKRQQAELQTLDRYSIALEEAEVADSMLSEGGAVDPAVAGAGGGGGAAAGGVDDPDDPENWSWQSW
jgi:hypothetical protein